MKMLSLKDAVQIIFKSSLESVRPEGLVMKALHRRGNIMYVNGREYQLNNNVKVVGFGKAVYGMTVGVKNVLKDHVRRGILSVPHNTSLVDLFPGKIQVLEGARNNLPDEESLRNANLIERFVRNEVSVDDILLVLISGGGSALLSSPVDGITLEEKLHTIKTVANNGGDIQMLNTVRKNLSRLKGGKLVQLSPTKNVISLIISDIVGDPLDLIASAPTVYDLTTHKQCLQIFDDLRINNEIPDSVMKHLQTPKTKCDKSLFETCNNVLVGSNTILIEKAAIVAAQYGFEPFIMTSMLVGDAEFVGERIADIISCYIQRDFMRMVEILIYELHIKWNAKHLLKQLREDRRNLCFIFGGETTVSVKGNGRGGRNQHMVLSTLKHLKSTLLRDNTNPSTSFMFLSAGSDGQDGPTDAAGAYLDAELLHYCTDKDLNSYLENCGSYEFFISSNFTTRYLLKTGLTGTNVMDVQLLMFKDIKCAL